ncbi:MAG: DUF58 domain-containing protein [Halieaceae bacterium]|jgi:uncharacterized protein (DUF58 family)|nr:DUF58 domain-containing protein [Halieaceae bacterium]
MSRDLDAPVRGATVDTAELIANRFAGRLLNVTAASRLLANLAGQKRSRQRGRGLEFEEVRQYVPGDDVRAIDWRVTARSGEPHTKLFHEDHEQPITVAIDLRTPMKFGSVNAFKSVLAAHTASLLLWSALDRGERVGAMVLHDNGINEIRPKRSRNTVLHAIGALVSFAQPAESMAGQPESLAALLTQLQRSASPGGRVFLISDFHDGLNPGSLEPIRQLAKRCQVVAIHISDPLEAHLPSAGRYSVSDGHRTTSLDTADTQTRAMYERQFAEQLAALSRSYKDYRIPMLQLGTDRAPMAVLQKVFPGR